MKFTYKIMLRGDWQIIFENKIGRISLISPSWVTSQTWEIFSYENLFEDVERYTTLEGALKQISKYLQKDVRKSKIPINWAFSNYMGKA